VTAGAQNRLEELLERAAQDPAAGEAAFYEELLRAELYVAGRVHGEVEDVVAGHGTLAEGGQVGILPSTLAGEEIVAAFTSPPRFEEASGGRVPCLGLPAEVLFRRKPSHLKVVLNPGVWYGKELLPGEIRDLLGDNPSLAEPPGEMMLGLPAVRPSELIERLRDRFARDSDVLAARLGQLFVPSSGVPPHLVVGLVLRDGADLERALFGIDALVRETVDGPVDFVPLGDHPIGDWLVANGEPFYTRAPSQADPPGEPKFLIGEPKEEPVELLDTIRRFADGRSEIRAAYRGLLVHPPAVQEAVIGFALANGADAAAVIEDVAAAAREAGFERLALLVLDDGPVARFLVERTQPFFTRDEPLEA
jgi:hypothetical protein